MPHEHDGITFNPWVDDEGNAITDSLPSTAGNYYLEADVTLSARWTVPSGTTNLCLNGYVIHLTSSDRGVHIGGGSTLILYDCNSTKQTHNFTVDLDGPWTPTTNTATKTLAEIIANPSLLADGLVVSIPGGCMTGATSSAVVSNDTTSVFTMFGGTIVGNSGTNGGGVCVMGGTFTMSGGNIIGNFVHKGQSGYDGDGGGVYMYFGGRSFTMSGGNIVGNSAENRGGGVYCSGKFNVSVSPVIKGNTKTDGTANDVHLTAVDKLKVTSRLSGAEIWIAAPATDNFGGFEPQMSSKDDAQATAACFFPDTGLAKAEAIDADGDGSYDTLQWDTNPALIKYNGTPYYGTADAGRTSITDTGSPFAGASYDSAAHILTMRADTPVSLDYTLEVVAPKSNDKPFTIDLNGQVLQRDSTKGNFSVITIGSGAELAVTDSGSGKHYFTVQDAGQPWLLDDNTKTGAIPLSQITDASQLVQGMIIEVTGGVITGGQKSSNGGGVYVDKGSKFTLSGGNIVGNSARNGGGVYVDEDSKFTLSGGNIIGNIANGNTGSNGGGVYVYNGDFTMSGGNIIGNIANGSGASAGGGGVYVSSNGTFGVTNGKIAGNKAINFGGGVLNCGPFTFNDGIITGNTARNGGGVYVNGSGSFTMSGGSITKNTVTDSGGGVYVYGTFNLSGSPVIKDNMGKGAADNVCLAANKTITITAGGLGNSAYIGVTPKTLPIGTTPVSIATGAASGDEAYFKSDVMGYETDFDSPNSNVTLKKSMVAELAKVSGGSDQFYTVAAAVADVDKVDQDGNLIYTGPVTMIADSAETALSISKEVTIDLNGHVLKNTKSNSSVITVSGSDEVTVTDSSTSSADHWFDYGGAGKAWILHTGTAPTPGTTVKTYTVSNFNREEADTFLGTAGNKVYINVPGGVITGGTGSSGYGGGVNVTGGTFTMSGGNIVGNSANYGGGVEVQGGMFNLEDGRIIGNTATGKNWSGGGGVYVESSGNSFTMSGGSIIGNYASGSAANDSGGGGVFTKMPFTMSGGSITGNSASSSGGVFIKSGGTFIVSGTPVIKDNKKTDETANNVEAQSNVSIKLTAPFTAGEIRITTINGASPAAAGEKFGEIENTPTGADRFKADGTANLVGDISGTDLVWKAGASPTPVPPAPTPTPVPTATVTFNVQGHGTAPASQTIDVGSKAARPADPSAEYYTFGGWYTEPACTNEWNFDTPVNSDMTLYAKWTVAYYAAKMSNYTYGGGVIPNPYLLPEELSDAMYFYSATADGPVTPWTDITTTSLDAGTWYIGAEAPGHPEAVIHRSTFTVEQGVREKPVISAYESTGEIIVSIAGYDPKETYMYSVTEEAANAGENWKPVTASPFTIAGLKAGTTYEIKVKINAKGNYGESISDPQRVTTGSTFSVTYNANGGVGKIEPQTGTAGESISVKSSDGITREGYDFDEWNTQADGSGISYYPGDTVSEGVVLYAQWAGLPYTITFDGNGGTVSQKTQTLYYGSPAFPLEAAASRSGYVHSGWAVSSTGSAVYAPAQDVQNLGDITLYAVWTPAEKLHGLTVNVENADGTPAFGATVQLRQGNAVIMNGISITGSVTFSGIPEGIYTLEAVSADKTKTSTESVTITGDHEKTIVFSAEDVSAKVNVSAKNATPAIAVDGVNETAADVAEFGKSVTVTVKVEAKVEGSSEEPQTQIEIEKIKDEADAGSELQYLGITVEKTVDDTTTPLTRTENLLTFIIPYDFTDKTQVKLYRCHEGEAKPLKELGPEEEPSDGTYRLDKENGVIYLYAQQFSTYCVGYIPVSPKPPHKSSTQGVSVWATETPTVTPTPTAEPTQSPTQGVPTVKPTEQPTPAKSPIPFMGMLAGLGAAAAVFGLRRK